jgi:hypothetical protein
MTVIDLLTGSADELIAEATDSVLRARLAHYTAAGREETRARIGALYALLLECLARKNAAAMIAHSRKIAEERWAAGFDLQEVQGAFNAIEELVWKRILASLPPDEFAQAIGMVSTVLGMGKDALARAYVSLATRSRAPSLDLKALFGGTEGY